MIRKPLHKTHINLTFWVVLSGFSTLFYTQRRRMCTIDPSSSPLV